MMFYCTLADVKAELKADKSTEDDALMRHVRQVSRRVDRIMGGRPQRPAFGPYVEELDFLIDGYHVNTRRNTFKLPHPLLELTTATAGDTTVTSVIGGYPSGASPIRLLRISSSGLAWYDYITTYDDPTYLTINGIWGYHGDWSNAWLEVDALAAELGTSATTMTVDDVDGDDAYGFPNRISRGTLVKFGDGDEYAEVTGTDASADTATLKRAVNGTSAPSAAYAADTAVYVFQVEEPVRRVVARQAALLYARRGAYQQKEFNGIGVVSYPNDLLGELKNTLSEYMYG